MPNEALPENTMNDTLADSLFVRIMVAIWSKRRLLFIAFVIILALAGVTAWLLPKSYTTMATFQIKTKESPSLGSQLGKGLKMLDPLSSENSGVSTVMAIFESRQLAVEMVKKFNLMKKYNTEWLHLAIKRFQKSLIVDSFADGIIHMEFNYDSMDSVKLIADSILAYVDARNRQISTSKAKLDFEFLVTQEQKINSDLEAINDSAISLLKRFNMADFSSQMELGLSQIASLDQEIIKLSSQQKLMETENSGSMLKMKQVRNVIGYLQSKQKNMFQGKPISIGGSKFAFSIPYDSIPRLQKEFKLFELQVKKNEGYLMMLLPKVQDARISMVENTPTISFIDPTYDPGYKSKPSRLLVIALITVPAMFLAVVWVILADFLRNPAYSGDSGRKLVRYIRSKSG